MSKQWYGSVNNRLMEGRQCCSEITVGTGATEILYSDRHPYTVIEIKSLTRIVVQQDNYKRIDTNGFSESQQYDYSRNLNGRKVELIKTKRGWKEYKGSSRFVVGRREYYYDFSI